MEIELEKRNEYIQNAKDAFKEFFESKGYKISEEDQQIKATYKGDKVEYKFHKVILNPNIPEEEYLMGASAGWTLINSKDKSKYTISLYRLGYKIICNTNCKNEFYDVETMQEVLQKIFKDL